MSKLEQARPMVGGEGDYSYANNSDYQKAVISQARPLIEEALLDFCSTTSQQSVGIGIADLGCSSGPNSLFVISEIINNLQDNCKKTPEYLVFLNDLLDNDFNTIFKSLPSFYEGLKRKYGDDFGPCLVAGMPGSFYGRLFAAKTLHIVHSSCSLHWLSKVPEGLQTERGIPLNKGNIYAGETSPPSIYQTYLNQFQKDFSLFLRSRAEEIVPGGKMVLTFQGRRSSEKSCEWELLLAALKDLVSEGIVEEAKLDSFNLPFYAPNEDEVKYVTEKEGSFHINKLEVHGFNIEGIEGFFWLDKFQRAGSSMSKAVRAVTENMLVCHFGNAMIDDLFERLTRRGAEFLPEKDKVVISNIVLSLTRRG